jgi:hypothetical protein
VRKFTPGDFQSNQLIPQAGSKGKGSSGSSNGAWQLVNVPCTCQRLATSHELLKFTVCSIATFMWSFGLWTHLNSILKCGWNRWRWKLKWCWGLSFSVPSNMSRITDTSISCHCIHSTLFIRKTVPLPKSGFLIGNSCIWKQDVEGYATPIGTKNNLRYKSAYSNIFPRIAWLGKPTRPPIQPYHTKAKACLHPGAHLAYYCHKHLEDVTTVGVVPNKILRDLLHCFILDLGLIRTFTALN